MSLENNINDKIAMIAKGVLGAVPFVGSMVSEIVGSLIPNQRVDRIVKYMQLLETKLVEIPEDRWSTLTTNDEFINLLEEGFVQASRATSDERREYISQAIVTGINEETVNMNEAFALLRLLQELSDVEVIWLRYHAFDNTVAYNEFHRLHRELFTYIRVNSRTDEDRIRKQALKDECRNHLERLGLIQYQRNLDPYIYNMVHRQKITPQGYESTKLGRVLLKQIGLIDNINLRT